MVGWKQSRKALLPAAALAMGISSGALAADDNVDVQAELKALRSKVAQLEAKSDGAFLDERRTEEVKTLVRDVLADADTRASLAEGGSTAGWNKGFFLASADGNFLLKVGGQLQLRYIFDHRQQGAAALPGTNDDSVGGFQIRRSKIEFSGYVYDPKLTYKILMAPNRDSGTVEIEDVWAAYEVMDGVKVQAGRFQDYFSREQMNSSKRQLTVERGLCATLFAGGDGFTEGVAVIWKHDNLRLAGSFNDGMNSGLPGGPTGGGGFVNQPGDFSNDSADAAFTGRADYVVAGDWKQYDDFSSWSSDPLSIIVGGGAHYEVGETGDRQAHATTTATGAYDKLLTYTADVSVKNEGLSIFGAGYGMHIDGTATNARKTSDIFGAMVQVSYMVIPDKLEPFVRYEWIKFPADVNADDLTSLTVGANYYFYKHDVKLTVDATYFFNAVTAGAAIGNGLSGLGYNNDNAGEQGQIAIRAQLQLLF